MRAELKTRNWKCGDTLRTGWKWGASRREELGDARALLRETQAVQLDTG